MALVDRGENGIVAGADYVWIGGPDTPRYVNITGMDNHQLTDIRIGTVGALAQSNYGKVILIFHEAAHVGRNQTILSAIQMTHYYNRVDDRAIRAAGGQQIKTIDEHNFALSIVNVLPYVQMRPYTEEEFHTLPYVIMTSEKEWDPRVFDNLIDPTDPNYNAVKRPNHKLLQHDDYDVNREYIGLA